MDLPHDGYQMSRCGGRVRQPPYLYDWPPVCSVCAEPCGTMHGIEGVSHSVSNFLLLIVFRTASTLSTWVYLREDCKRRDRWRVIWGIVAGIGFVVHSVLIIYVGMAYGGDGWTKHLTVVGAALAVVGPLIVAFISIVRARIPLVWKFNSRFTEIKFRSRDYIEEFRHALETQET